MTDWAPKGPRNYPLSNKKRNVFPLDEDSPKENTKYKDVVKANFRAMDSTDDGEVMEAVKSVDPYLHPKNQIILRALIKLNSIVRDVGNLKQAKTAQIQGNTVSKPLSFKEGLQIAREMSPYLAPGTRNQVETIFEGINRVSHLKNNVTKVQNAENTDIKIDYILESIKPFVAFNKYNQVKQMINIGKIFQTTKSLSEDDDLTSSGDSNETTKDKNSELSDIIGLLDQFDSKKNKAE